nr:unnamed protein product [Callosobruchus chinensis]
MDRITWVANKTLDLRRKPFGLFIRDTKLKRRAILKNGEYNILQPKFPNRYWNYLKDPYTSLVDAEWKWNLQAMAVGFLGTIIDSFTVGAVIAKLTKPTMSNSTIMFTRNAVICLMDGVLCLMFRVGDLRKRKLIGTNAKTSYLSCEILWGQRFVSLLSFNEKHQSYEANFKLFDKMEWVETPFCSAAEYEAQASEENKAKQSESKTITSSDSASKAGESASELNGLNEETVPKDNITDLEQECKDSHSLSRFQEQVRDWEYCRHQIPIYQDIIQEEDEDEDSDGRGDTPPFPITWV